jgi:transcriptional regulator with XRE-family HTH domain
MQLGKKIRSLRFRRGLTVQQLAEASNLSKGFISQVENDRTSPSLATLRDLARALDTSVAYLVVEDEQAPYVVREFARPKIQREGSAARVEVLSAQPRRALEVLMAELPPGASSGPGREFPSGEQCIVCLEGQVAVNCGEHRVVLDAGDACHHDGHLPYTVENSGGVPARAMISIAPHAYDSVSRVRQNLTDGVEVGST